MTITIDLRKVKNFVLSHKEAVAVGVIAALVIHKQNKRIEDMNEFIAFHQIGA